MAHALYEYDGLCRNIHGHTYHLNVTLSGKVKEETGHPKDGMVLDFGLLKKIVEKQIVDIYDHALVVNANFPEEQLSIFKKSTERLIAVAFQPTTENLVAHFAEVLQPELPANVTLFSIRLYETENSYAEWFSDDNA